MGFICFDICYVSICLIYFCGGLINLVRGGGLILVGWGGGLEFMFKFMWGDGMGFLGGIMFGVFICGGFCEGGDIKGIFIGWLEGGGGYCDIGIGFRGGGVVVLYSFIVFFGLGIWGDIFCGEYSFFRINNIVFFDFLLMIKKLKNNYNREW